MAKKKTAKKTKPLKKTKKVVKKKYTLKKLLKGVTPENCHDLEWENSDNQTEREEPKLVQIQPSASFLSYQKQQGRYLESEMQEDLDKITPSIATEGSAGIDLRAFLGTNTAVIEPGKTLMIGTGFIWAIPRGYFGMVCSRSGLAAKQSVFVLNAPGIVDSDYTGEVCIILHNLGFGDFIINNGDRIAQMVISPMSGHKIKRVMEIDLGPKNLTLEAKKAKQLADAGMLVRGDGGFGSTGIE